MCGIVAIAGRDTVEHARLDHAIRALAHRGPDGRGTWTAADRSCALGHTRLAVIDPAGGAQPIANEDGSIVAVVNGELYGFAEHAPWLRDRGHVLRTRCDAEVLVHLYEELGDDVVRVLRGELAFVLWDARRRTLLAGRDRFGVKPLVWARWRDGVVLASEAKALFALGVPARWDDEMMFHAAHTQYPWPDRTMFAGVQQLEPGCVLRWSGGEPAVARYWDLPIAPRRAQDRRAPGTRRDDAATETLREDAAPEKLREDAATELRGVVADAVGVRLRADARICVQLSGGLDSSTVAALAARAGGVEACFTVGFDAGAYDERAQASATAAALGLPLHIVPVTGPDIAEHWATAVTHGEGLAINGHLVGKWMLSRAMRDAGYKVALTGEGADELLAGYPHLRQDAGVAIAGHVASRGVMLPAGAGLPLAAVQAQLGFVPTWLAAKASLGQRTRSLLSADLRRRHAEIDPYAALIDRLGAERLRQLCPLHASATTWIRTALAQYILRTLGDGMEMAHGIEGRVPFLDHHVAEVAFGIDPAVAAGASDRSASPSLDKPVLRRAVHDLVPAAVLARPKHPFLAPPLSRLAPALVQDTLRAHARQSSLVDGPALVAVLDALPAMSEADQQAWDPALMLMLSAAVLEARYCR